MSILLCVGWGVFCCLFMGLGLLALDLAERSLGSHAMAGEEAIDKRAPRIEDFGFSTSRCADILQAPKLAADTDVRTELESTVPLVRRDASVVIHRMIADLQGTPMTSFLEIHGSVENATVRQGVQAAEAPTAVFTPHPSSTSALPQIADP